MNSFVSVSVEKEFISMNRTEGYCSRIFRTCFAMRSRKALPSFTSKRLLAFS